MTVAQVMEVKNFITDAYQVKFGAAWNPARTVVKEFHSHSITISHEGNLMVGQKDLNTSEVYVGGCTGTCYSCPTICDASTPTHRMFNERLIQFST